MRKHIVKTICMALCLAFILSAGSGSQYSSVFTEYAPFENNIDTNYQNSNNSSKQNNNSTQSKEDRNNVSSEQGEATDDSGKMQSSYPQKSESASSVNATENNSFGFNGIAGNTQNNSGASSKNAQSQNNSSTFASSTASSKSLNASSSAAQTQAELNSQKMKSLYNAYGVTVLAGNDAEYWVNGKCYTGITDESKIATWLTYLERELKRYPKGFFNDFNDISEKFKIKLFKSLWPSTAGFASYEFANDFFIGINCSETSFPSRVFNHEIMHMIDRYIYLTVWDNTPLSKTVNYCGGELGNVNNSYTIYDTSVTINNRYFITSYAKTNEREDRAETFTDYMFRPYKKDYMMKVDYPIVKKMHVIANAIRQFFPSANAVPKGQLAWEKLLTY